MNWRIQHGDVRDQLQTLESQSVQTCVTSPPYWGLRDYGHADQIGLEATPEAYTASLVSVFAEVRRVLKDDGTLWLNLGDSYATGAGSGRSMGGDCFGKQNQVIDAASYPICQPNRMPIIGLKPKDLIGIPWRVAFALQAGGWYLRSDIIWSKPNPMPESATDRPTKAHEYLFLLSKRASYYYDADAISERAVKVGTLAHLAGGSGKRAGSREGLRRDEWMARKRVQEPVSQPLTKSDVLGHPPFQLGEITNRVESEDRNKRSVWTVATQPYPDAHFATFPEALIEPCILAGSKPGDTVLDPFCGSGTTGAVAVRHQRNFIGCELNPAYVELARRRIGRVAPLFAREGPAA